MAILPIADRADIAAEFGRGVSDDRERCAAIKAEVRAAVDALDAFLDANAAAINTAIPQPARGTLTTPQKARLLMYVIRRRYLMGV